MRYVLAESRLFDSESIVPSNKYHFAAYMTKNVYDLNTTIREYAMGLTSQAFLHKCLEKLQKTISLQSVLT
jgi:hypothetical protein